LLREFNNNQTGVSCQYFFSLRVKKVETCCQEAEEPLPKVEPCHRRHPLPVPGSCSGTVTSWTQWPRSSVLSARFGRQSASRTNAHTHNISDRGCAIRLWTAQPRLVLFSFRCLIVFSFHLGASLLREFNNNQTGVSCQHFFSLRVKKVETCCLLFSYGKGLSKSLKILSFAFWRKIACRVESLEC